MDEIYDDDDSLSDNEFNEPTVSNDDFFFPFNRPPDVKDWMIIIGPLSDKEGLRRWERKWNENNYIPF